MHFGKEKAMNISIKSSVKSLIATVTAAAMTLSFTAVLPDTTKVYAASQCVIDSSETHQTIKGFGGINHPEWTGQDMTTAQRQTAFGNGDNELGLTILRVFVNPDSNQWKLAVPTAKYASDNGVTVFASPWEPPANLAESGGSNGKLHIPKSNYGAYAEHLNNFGTYMKNNGVDLYSISVQNEPDFAEEWTYWSTDETTDFLANYGDKITSTRLMSPESFQYAPLNASWVSDGGKKFYKKIMENSKAFANCDLFGTHFYGTARDWMDYPELENCGKEIWMTEVYVPNSDADSANRYPEAIQVSENIHNAMVVGNMSAYTWWYIRRNYGLMTEDGKISKRGYCMAQYSKYVRPGDVRITATEQPADDVLVSAYKNNDGDITVVAVNKSDTGYAQEFSLKNESISNVTRYRTSANENLAKTADMEYTDNSFFAQLPAQSVSTFVIKTGEKTVTSDADGYYFHDEFEDGNCDWEARGGNKLELSGRAPYMGTNALISKERTAAWNGVQKSLNMLKTGESYSFSVCVSYLDGDVNTENFSLTLQYTDASGETQYKNIDSKTAVKGEYVQLANTSYTIPKDAKNPLLVVETTSGTMNFYIDEAIVAPDGTEIDGPKEITLKIGDLNNDGKINVFDFCISKNIMNDGYHSTAVLLAADVNQDTMYDIEDIKLLQQYIVKLITKFPILKPPVTDEPTEPVNPEITDSEYMNTVKLAMQEYAPSGITAENAGTAYGTLTKYQYYSTTRGRMTNVNVLLPPGYNENEKYPVLYALHGFWENEDSLAEMSSARTMLGNLIASGEAKKMIVVFPYIYTSKTQESCSGLDLQNSLAYDNFINDLTTDLMPYINKNFSVKTGRENTAITGFSMGARESLFIGLTRSDLFGYVGASCPAPGLTPGTDLSLHPGQLQESELKPTFDMPRLIMITGGGNDSVVGGSPSSYDSILTKNSVEHLWHFVTNGQHNASSVQPHFYNYLKAIFK